MFLKYSFDYHKVHCSLFKIIWVSFILKNIYLEHPFLLFNKILVNNFCRRNNVLVNTFIDDFLNVKVFSAYNETFI